MEAIQLEDIVPQGASFHLKKTDKTYHLNPVMLSDELWMQQTFGAELEIILKEVRMKEICRIVFRLMTDEDKQDFLKKEVQFINEEGDSMTKSIGGAELLFLLVSGFNEKIAIFEALLRTIGVSRPIQDALTDVVEKKTQMKLEPIGHKSSTSSRPSMDGRVKRSSPVRPKRSVSGSKLLRKEKSKR